MENWFFPFTPIFHDLCQVIQLWKLISFFNNFSLSRGGGGVISLPLRAPLIIQLNGESRAWTNACILHIVLGFQSGYSIEVLASQPGFVTGNLHKNSSSWRRNYKETKDSAMQCMQLFNCTSLLPGLRKWKRIWAYKNIRNWKFNEHPVHQNT